MPKNKKVKYKVECQEIMVTNKKYCVSAEDESEARRKVIRREWDDILADILVSRSEPFSFKITPIEEK